MNDLKEKKDESQENDSNKEIEEEIEYLNQSLDGKLSEEDKENIRKILEYLGAEKKKSKWSIFLMNFRNYLVHYLEYFLVYFALFGMMNGVIKYTDSYKILIFISGLSLYMVLFKELLSAYLKPGLHLYVGILLFLILSIFIIHEVLTLSGLLSFVNLFYLIVYFLVAEIIIYAIKYYISKHIFERILR